MTKAIISVFILFLLLLCSYGCLQEQTQYLDTAFPGASGDSWCDNDYAKRIDVNVDNTGGSALTDHEVYVDLGANPINEASIRVYNATDCTLRSDWSENTTTGNSYAIWVNYSAIAGSSWCNDTSIYYDNAAASSVSSIEDTFMIGNDGTPLNINGDIFTLKDTLAPSYPNDFDVYDNGNRTIIAEYNGNKISLYNSVDKTNLQLLDHIAVANAHDVRVIDGDNDYAYYVAWTGGSATFGVLNLTNEAAITIEDSITLANAFYCRAYNISGNLTVFVVNYTSNGLTIYNVTDHSITELDSITGNGANYDIRTAWRVMYHPGYKLAIVGAYGGDGCTSVFDVSNLSTIVPKNKYCGAKWKWSNLFIEDNKVYGQASMQDSVEVATINSDGTLTWLGNYTSSAYLDNAHGIYVEDDIIYAVSWFNDGITILNATNPAAITYVTGIYSPVLMNERHAVEFNKSYIWTAGASASFTVHEYNASAAVPSEWTVKENSVGFGTWVSSNGVINVTTSGDTLSFLYHDVQTNTNNYAIAVKIRAEDGLTTSNYQQGIRFDVVQSTASRGYFKWMELHGWDKWVIGGESTYSSSSSDTNFDARNWHKYEFIKNGSSWHGYCDDVLKVSRTETWNAQYVGMLVYYGDSGHWVNFDDFRVRKYAFPEPSTTLGSEEDRPAGDSTETFVNPTWVLIGGAFVVAAGWLAKRWGNRRRKRQ